MDALSLIRGAGRDAASHRNGLLRFLGLLLLWHPALLAAKVDLPERPTGYLMDRGEVLSPEKAREISAALAACARDSDIHIYLLTLPTLGVMPSRAREKLDALLETAQAKWMTGKSGAVIIFDYETGGASMGESEEARKIFSPISINLIFDDPQLQYTRQIRASEQLERAAKALIKRFSHLRQQAAEEARQRRTENRIFGGIAGSAILLGFLLAVAKRRFTPAPVPASRPTPLVLADE